MSDFAELHDDLRGVARDLLAKDVDAEVRWRQIADAGWLGLEVPEALDGSGATFAETAVVLEQLGRTVTATPFLGTAVLGVAAMQSVEAGETRDQLLRTVAAGSARVAVALAPHADSCAAEAAFRLDDAGRLRGRADLVPDAAGADHVLVLADSDRSPALVLVAATTRSGTRDRREDVGSGGQNGVGVELVVVPELVLDATRAFGSVSADGVAVPPDQVWPIDPGAAQGVLDRGAVALAADAYGVASAMLDATVAYVGARHQFGRPVGSFQAAKHQCADALVQLRIGRQLLDEAVDALAAGDVDAGIAASRAKSYLGDAAVDVVGTAMQLHGGIGYTWESGIHRFLKRALLDRSLLGSPAAHRRRIADHLWP